MDEVAWFELKNGSYIGVSDFGLIYGERSSSANAIIDEQIRHNSQIRIADYPDGFELELNEPGSWACIQKNKYRFSSSEEVAQFRNRLQVHFPASEVVVKTEKITRVSREPLWALVVLVVCLLIGMSMNPALVGKTGGNGRTNALLVILGSIPKIWLITGYVVLSGIALYNVRRLWKQYQQTVFLVVRDS